MHTTITGVIRMYIYTHIKTRINLSAHLIATTKYLFLNAYVCLMYCFNVKNLVSC